MPPISVVPINGPEREQLTAFLDYFREVFLKKSEGLTAEQLAFALPPSNLTLGGLLYHMDLVEDIWFSFQFLGEEEREPWASVDWDADQDWDFTNANKRTPEQLIEGYQGAVSRSQAATTAAESLDQKSKRTRDGQHWDLRWIMLHMLEEYARHCGHADYLREAIDGKTGD